MKLSEQLTQEDTAISEMVYKLRLHKNKDVIVFHHIPGVATVNELIEALENKTPAVLEQLGLREPSEKIEASAILKRLRNKLKQALKNVTNKNT